MATVIVQEYQKITTTGTAVALATANDVDWVAIKAPRGNEFVVHIGSSTVTATGATTDGYPLVPGDSVRFGGCDLADIYINGHAGDGVYYVASSGYVLPAT